MSLYTLMSLTLLNLCVLVLLIDQVLCSPRGGPFFKRTAVNSLASSPSDFCAAAVTIHGYKCQQFIATTDDGYILSVIRIPEGRAGGSGKNRQPVLLQHGILVDGMTWLLNSPEESLGFILADNGFDVWISNTRGTRFSRQHNQLNPNSPSYWDWTWDDLVVHELPALFNLLFEQTGQKTNYVGHSMGTLMALAYLSEGKQIEKVKSAALLSPIAYLSHMTSTVGVLLANAFADKVTTILGVAEFNPIGKEVANLLKILCMQPGVNCYDLLTALTGSNCCLNSSTVQLFIKHEPQSTATKNMAHLAQTARDGTLTKYDYGIKSNLQRYGYTNPPAYNLANIPKDFPLFLSYGGRDGLSDSNDVSRLLDDLKTHDEDKLHVQYIQNYAHADFIMGVTAKDVVYNQIVNFFQNQG